jgi:UDP-N-acetyl-D-galactosamine dehydrogenase
MEAAALPRADETRVAVIGLGYVGLPLAVGFGRQLPTLGFDINKARVAELKDFRDHTLETTAEELKATKHLRVSSDPADLRDCNVFVVTVPTPIDDAKRPDLSPLESASRTVGKAIRPGGVVIFESTVYPGATEEVCVPIIERESGLKYNVDFYAGYSPERINPGDKQHRLETITKVTSGSTPEAADFVDALYRRVVTAGTHKASSIRVAEAAKVIENTQRDLNIALITELALIFHRLGIDTSEVLAAAGTKWNFLPFRPGLVGGHCIGVDPYYLTTKAQQLGYQPEVITAGRRINDNVGRFIAQRLVKLLVNADVPVKGARVGVLGITFKEDVTDIRNSRVPDIVRELQEFGINALVHDPIASPAEVKHEYGITLASFEELRALDAVVLAVSHKAYGELGIDRIVSTLRDGGIVVDVKSAFEPSKIDKRVRYWSL